MDRDMIEENFEIVKGYCKACNQINEMFYNGEQPRLRGKRPLHLYTCLDCESTVSYESDEIDELLITSENV